MLGGATGLRGRVPVYTFALLFGFWIDRPNCGLSSIENATDFARLDDPDGLFRTSCCHGKSMGTSLEWYVAAVP